MSDNKMYCVFTVEFDTDGYLTYDLIGVCDSMDSSYEIIQDQMITDRSRRKFVPMNGSDAEDPKSYTYIGTRTPAPYGDISKACYLIEINSLNTLIN